MRVVVKTRVIGVNGKLNKRIKNICLMQIYIMTIVVCYLYAILL